MSIFQKARHIEWHATGNVTVLLTFIIYINELNKGTEGIIINVLLTQRQVWKLLPPPSGHLYIVHFNYSSWFSLLFTTVVQVFRCSILTSEGHWCWSYFHANFIFSETKPSLQKWTWEKMLNEITSGRGCMR